MQQAPVINMGSNGQHMGSNEQAASEESARDSANNNRAASGSAAAAGDEQCQPAAPGGNASNSAHQQAHGRRPAKGTLAQGCAAGQQARCARSQSCFCWCLSRHTCKAFCPQVLPLWLSSGLIATRLQSCNGTDVHVVNNLHVGLRDLVLIPACVALLPC